MALHQRQAAGFRKQVDQHHRLVIHFQIVGFCNVPEHIVPDIGPWGLERKIVIDLTRHTDSPNLHDCVSQQTRTADARSILAPLRAYDAAPVRARAIALAQFNDVSSMALISMRTSLERESLSDSGRLSSLPQPFARRSGVLSAPAQSQLPHRAMRYSLRRLAGPRASSQFGKRCGINSL